MDRSVSRWRRRWLRQGAAAPRRRAVDGRRRRGRRCPGAAPAHGRRQEEEEAAAAGAGSHARNAQATGGGVRPPGVPREVLALRGSVSQSSALAPLFLLVFSMEVALSCESISERFLSGSCLPYESQSFSSAKRSVRG